MQFTVIKSASGFAIPSSGIPSILEISTVPVPGTCVATLGMPGPSQDHVPPTLVVCVSQGPSQDHHPPSPVVSHSQGPPQDHLGQSTASLKCPPQDSSQPQTSTSGPLQDPWSILGSSESAIPSVCEVPTLASLPASSSCRVPGSKVSYWGVNAHFHSDKMLEEWPTKTLLNPSTTPQRQYPFTWIRPFPALPFLSHGLIQILSPCPSR